MKLLIISSMSNVFRNRILTEFFDEKKIQYKILSPRFKNPFLVPITKKTIHIIFKNSIKLLLYFFRYLFDFPNKIYWLLKSDFVYINSMGKYYQLDLKIAWVLKKKIIVDFYSLYYIAIVLDQKLVKNMISNRILMR